ncbi:MAG: YncE family protein, partial [Alphaproteobacteria bacterium]|nr:YncE family protein [Alphaproteobacteria bacterium]
SDSRKLSFVDVRTLALVGSMTLDTGKAESTGPDGAGGLLLNEKDRDMVAHIDIASRKIIAEWPTTGCDQPTGMAVDPEHHRAFIGCRGNKPVLEVMDMQTGKVVASLPLGRGNDGVVYDAASKRIITTNGIEGNIVIYHQEDADHYRMEQAITTRPMARTIAYDPLSASIFTVTAEGVVDPAKEINTGPSAFYPNAYYDNSFVVLTYAPNHIQGGKEHHDQ